MQRHTEHDRGVAVSAPAVKRLPDLLILHALQQELRIIRDVPASGVLNLIDETPLTSLNVLIDDLSAAGLDQVSSHINTHNRSRTADTAGGGGHSCRSSTTRSCGDRETSR